MGKKDEFRLLNIDSSYYKTRISKKFDKRQHYEPANQNIIKNFIPGTVLNIIVCEGQTVHKGDDLLILDAMKMQNRIKSRIEGRIKKIFVCNGDKVSKGAILFELE